MEGEARSGHFNWKLSSLSTAFYSFATLQFPFFKASEWFDGLIDTILYVMVDLGLYFFN